VERPFVAGDRQKTTILLGGLTRRHEGLVQAGFRGCGYECECLPLPDYDALQLGKEFGNPGQCNPAYFTIGSLLEYLKHLEASGLSRHEIIDRYVFFTAGSCGPCRFGMYESEYRLALQNAGFDGFRVLLFRQDDLRQQGVVGLQYSMDFGVRMLLALQLGDALNALAFQIRPYEVLPGTTNRVMDQCVEILAARLSDPQPFELASRLPSGLRALAVRCPRLAVVARRIGTYVDREHGKWIRAPIERCRDLLATIEVDRTRVKPVVKITGEFWAQTTEGDGNYRMFEALEREGAEVLVEPIGAWVTYLLSHARLSSERRFHLEAFDRRSRLSRYERIGVWWRHRRHLFLLLLGERLYEYYHRRVGRLLGGRNHELAPQHVVARLASPFYNPLARGGEGHLEVGKTIYYTVNGLCHMVLSLKPFGCMPSAQSDGVQSAVASRYPGVLFVPIETSGDAEINALSRMQMALCDAHRRAREEVNRAQAASGVTLADVRAWAAARRDQRGALAPMLRRQGVAGTAANLVFHVARLRRRHWLGST
jgi:predicted nucleotide-binding protein (sugar kinase/HSP70/actin superfamily)